MAWRVAIDTAPLSTDPASIIDLSSEILCRLIYLPLIELDETHRVSPISAVQGWSEIDHGTFWQFSLRENLRCPCGVLIDAARVSRVLNANLSRSHRPIASWLRDAAVPSSEGVFSVCGRFTLALRLWYPVRYLPYLLTGKCFLVADSVDNARATGLYQIRHWGKSRVQLTINTNSHLADRLPTAIELIKVQTTAESIDLFAKKRIDLTDPFAVSAERAQNRFENDVKYQKRLSMFATLSVRSSLDDTQVSPEPSLVFDQDRWQKISAGGSDAFDLMSSFSEAFPEESALGGTTSAAKSRLWLTALSSGKSASLAFADFHPNADLAKHLGDLLQRVTEQTVRISPLTWERYLEEVLQPSAQYLLSVVVPDFDHPAAIPHAFYGYFAKSVECSSYKLLMKELGAFPAEATNKIGTTFSKLEDEIVRRTRTLPIARYTACVLRSKRAQKLRYTRRGTLSFDFN
jgi:hypothetical protein